MKQGWSSDEFVYHWKYYTSPSRASASDIEFMKKLIRKKGKKAKVLVLGATPEYRNICGELKIPVTMIDWKKFNVNYLKSEVKNKPKEVFIEGNWMKVKLKDKFDVILGDNVLNIFSKKDLPKLLKNVSLMLSKDGVFLARTHIKKKNERFTLLKIIKDYKIKNYRYGIYAGFLHNFYYLFYNKKKDCVIWKECYKKAKELLNKGLIDKEAMDYCDKLSWENRDFRVYFPPKDKLKRIVSKYFRIANIFYGKEKYLENRSPVYVLMKK